MSSQSEINIEEFIAALEAANRQARLLRHVQIGFTILSGLGVITIIALRVMGGHPDLVIRIGVAAMLFGFSSVIPGRMAQSIDSKLEDFGEHLKRARKERAERAHDAAEISKEAKLANKIPLTIGYANLSGQNFRDIHSEDVSALSVLFTNSRVVPDNQIPSAQILFVYAHLNEDGTIQGQPESGIRQIVQLTNSAIVVLASPNSSNSIQNAVALTGPRTANIVFTLDRNGSGFTRFFSELFNKMRDGTDMLNAWNELNPQGPHGGLPYAPRTILLAEGGKIAFPK